VPNAAYITAERDGYYAGRRGNQTSLISDARVAAPRHLQAKIPKIVKPKRAR
jgi:hypothetical protein